MTSIATQLKENLARVRERIARAAKSCGRSHDEIRLIAVTKYVDLPVVNALIEAGCTELGESRPQDLMRKVEALNGRGVEWHMIGHLQRNKARRILPHLTLLHSADSLRLLDAVNRMSGELGRTTDALLEVNISGDASKFGFAPSELQALLPQIAALTNVRIRGLMAMAGLAGKLEDARADFARLRDLRDRLAQDCPATISLNELSMGMSGDFEAAIGEGATMVRVGSALFEGLDA